MSRQCFTCKYFMKSGKPPHMRGCTFKGKLELNGAACGSYKPMHTIKDKLLRRRLPAKSMVI